MNIRLSQLIYTGILDEGSLQFNLIKMLNDPLTLSSGSSHLLDNPSEFLFKLNISIKNVPNTVSAYVVGTISFREKETPLIVMSLRVSFL